MDDDQPWVEAPLSPFRNRLAATAILVTAISVVLLVVVSWRSPGEGSWRLGDTSYAVLTTLLSTIISIGALSLIWEYVLRASYARSLHHYLALKASLVVTGLSHISDLNDKHIDLANELGRATRVRCMTRNPIDWTLRHLNSVMSAAKTHEIHVDILVPDPEGEFLGAVAQSLGLSEQELAANISTAVQTVKTRWQQAHIAASSSTIQIATVSNPLYDATVVNDMAIIELTTASDHTPGRGGLAFKFDGHGQTAAWIRSQFDDANVGAALWSAGPAGTRDYFRSQS